MESWARHRPTFRSVPATWILPRAMCLASDRTRSRSAVTATIGLDFERTISASSTDQRHVIADHLTRLEAKRVSLLGSSLMLKKQRPVKAVFDFSTGTTECAVVCHLTDNLANWMGKTWGVNRQYREIFEAVAQRVDLGLAELGGVAAQ